jgi:hypothetical protein
MVQEKSRSDSLKKDLNTSTARTSSLEVRQTQLIEAVTELRQEVRDKNDTIEAMDLCLRQEKLAGKLLLQKTKDLQKLLDDKDASASSPKASVEMVVVTSTDSIPRRKWDSDSKDLQDLLDQCKKKD